MTDEESFRRKVLRDGGASDDVIAELLPYTDTCYRLPSHTPRPQFPLSDESHVECWAEYASQGRRGGVFDVLQARLVQLRFPICAGMSQQEAYRRATRRGHFEAAESYAPGLVLRRPTDLRLEVVQTVAGGVPVLIARDREDFVTLVQALSRRNEPSAVPASMGACMVGGFNNWDRVARYRRAWEKQCVGSSGEPEWQEEFRRLIPRKALYQDRFMILSRHPYSATPAKYAGVGESEWLDRSLIIRQEHEGVHYFTQRVFGAMRTNVLDEIIADFVGLVRAFGGYPADLALRFLGLEAFPAYRHGGRLENYRGEPPLSDRAMGVVHYLAWRSIKQLQALSQSHSRVLDDERGCTEVLMMLLGLTFEELASRDLSPLLPPVSAPGSC